MLISFTVSNFRSFFEEQTLSLVASRRTSGHEGHLLQLPKQDEKLLPTAIFYGANGAGKSNLVRALQHMKNLVLRIPKQQSGVPHCPFALGPEGGQQPSSFEVRALLGEDIVEYGFKTTQEAITEEWLIHLKGSKETVIFERVTKGGSVTIQMDSALEKIKDAERVFFQSKAGALPDQLFLGTVAANIPRNERWGVIGKMIAWFTDELQIVAPTAPFDNLPGLISSIPQFAKFAAEYLKRSSTGVSNLRVTEELVPNAVAEFFADKKSNGGLPETIQTELFRNFKLDRSISAIGLNADGTVVKNTIISQHEGPDGELIDFHFKEESDGTRRLAHLLPAAYLGTLNPKVYVIDEIDRSLHPLLAKQFVAAILSSAFPRQSQLILTTHDTNLLDLDLFRRDEIWFAEKSKKGATEIYPLSDFKVRQDLRVEKGYLTGRFGGIPFLGGIEKLFPTNSPTTSTAKPKGRQTKSQAATMTA